VYSGNLVDPTSRCGNGRVDPGETCDREIRAGAPGACPTTCAGDDACAPMVLHGAGCDVECVAEPVQPSAEADGCCPDSANAENDADCSQCGDRQIGLGETCDPPDSCETPEDCVASALCTVAVFSGRAAECTAACAIEPLTECIDEDACCPAGCSFETDSDCPEDCGDGVVDADAGETCDPGDPSSACDEPCDDDDPCTLDEARGSPERCDVRCTHDPITRAHDDDGCCPPGVVGADDSDCAPACEPAGDDAADDDACGAPLDAADTPFQPSGQASDDDAPSDVPAPELECREVLTSSDDPASAECAECICADCLDVMRGCYLEGDPGRNAACSAIMQCKQRVGCVGDDCYCGTSRSCLVPDGPCSDEIDEASGPLVSLSVCVADPQCANYWSSAYTECLERNCTAPCR
jgi:hypothetical protein